MTLAHTPMWARRDVKIVCVIIGVFVVFNIGRYVLDWLSIVRTAREDEFFQQRGRRIQELKLSSDFTFVNHGAYKVFHVNGVLAEESTYVNGKQCGWEWRWDMNGRRTGLGYWDSGDRHGIAIEWYSSGSLRSEGSYFRGVKIGTWRSWDDEGILKSQEFFEIAASGNATDSRQRESVKLRER